ncbi:MAG: hypothetical protein ACJAT2_001380 [Bacteriovoracaceae bacterium]|jgi:hypothetical protein
MNSKIRLGASIGSLLVLLLSFNHCVLQPKASKKPADGSSTNQQQTNTSGNTGNTDPVDPVDPPNIVLEEVDVGVKNFEQVLETMSVLTGVDANTNSISNTYEDLKTQLPTNNDIKTFLPAHQVAVTKLAAEYCDELVDDSNLRGSVWPGFNFGGTPTNSLNPNGRAAVINQAIDKFWGLGTVSAADKNAAIVELQILMADLIVGEANNSATTRTVVKGVCIATLATARVTLL